MIVVEGTGEAKQRKDCCDLVEKKKGGNGGQGRILQSLKTCSKKIGRSSRYKSVETGDRRAGGRR